MPKISPSFDHDALAMYRQARGMSIQDLAAATDRTTWAVGAFEVGDVTPSLVTAYVLAKALEVPLGALYHFGEGRMVEVPGFSATTASHLASLAGALA